MFFLFSVIGYTHGAESINRLRQERDRYMIRYMQKLLIICGLLGFAAAPEIWCAGLTPYSRDGFETGDWRNFRPRYVGDAEHWIRPQFTVTQENPIQGEHSLRWRSNDDEHQWLMLSNAFFMRAPMALSVQFRVQSDRKSVV